MPLLVSRNRGGDNHHRQMNMGSCRHPRIGSNTETWCAHVLPRFCLLGHKGIVTSITQHTRKRAPLMSVSLVSPASTARGEMHPWIKPLSTSINFRPGSGISKGFRVGIIRLRDLHDRRLHRRNGPSRMLFTDFLFSSSVPYCWNLESSLIPTLSASSLVASSPVCRNSATRRLFPIV